MSQQCRPVQYAYQAKYIMTAFSSKRRYKKLALSFLVLHSFAITGKKWKTCSNSHSLDRWTWWCSRWCPHCGLLKLPNLRNKKRNFTVGCGESHPTVKFPLSHIPLPKGRLWAKPISSWRQVPLDTRGEEATGKAKNNLRKVSRKPCAWPGMKFERWHKTTSTRKRL